MEYNVYIDQERGIWSIQVGWSYLKATMNLSTRRMYTASTYDLSSLDGFRM